jgi:hypothetical protein
MRCLLAHDVVGPSLSRIVKVSVLVEQIQGDTDGGRPEPSADLLRQLDDDPLRAADVAEPITVVVPLHLAAPRKLATTASISSIANAAWRMPGCSGACRSSPRPGGA